MSAKRFFACLILCISLFLGTLYVPAAATASLAGCVSSSVDSSRGQDWPDWDKWKEFWEELTKRNNWPDKESAWKYWPLWWWLWPFGFNLLQWWNNRPDGNNSVPVISDPPSFYYDEIDDYNLYFGQLSAHTSLSDGKGSLNDAYRHARDVAGLDFFAVTDDSSMFDNAAEATLADGGKSVEWTGGKAIADAFTDSKFVAIFGYEMAWNNGNGHINTFNTNGFETASEERFSGSGGLLNYYNELKKHPGSISQFNHPGKEHGDFHDFGYYDKDIDALVSLIEVGNGEGAVGSDKYYRSYDYYTRALDKGWHLAPTNNQDNRGIGFGSSNTARTVVLAKKLTRDDLYDAMRNRRVYATEDKNLEIRYTLNGRIMGSIVNTSSDQVRIRVKLKEYDGETIGKVSVISSGGEIVTSQTLAVQSYTLDLTLPANRPYYYIRVDQFDKDIAVTAPVWVVKTGSSASGISRTYASTDKPKKGEPLKITMELYNAGPGEMKVSSVLFTVNGKAFKRIESPGTIKAGGTAAYSAEYTPPSAGKIQIGVVATVTVSGKAQAFSDNITLDCSNSNNSGKANGNKDKKDKDVPKKDEAVRKVCELIDRIYTKDYKISEPALKEARKSYNKLTEEQKKQVDNYWKLAAAEQVKEWEEYWSKGKWQPGKETNGRKK